MIEDGPQGPGSMRPSHFKRKRVSESHEQWIIEEPLHSGQSLPLVIKPAMDGVDLVAWAGNNVEVIERKILKHGALLFRGFRIDSIRRFEEFASAICAGLYGEYGDLPRETVEGKVYSSTPFPREEEILYHNESSHMQQWPMKIWFYCVKAAEKGGETPIVDCREVYEEIGAELREKFERKGLIYVRNYIEGLDVSWERFFKTESKEEVERKCEEGGIECEWSERGLRTRKRREAVARHPKTGEKVFFNQIQLHHISCLGEGVRGAVEEVYGEEGAPRGVYFGDGSRIEEEEMREIREIYERKEVRERWEEGDILMLDNMLVAHGRKRYEGERKVVVAMGEMMKEGGSK